MFRLAVAALLLLVLPARANLGDAVADCVKRYGKPVTFTEPNAETPFGTLVFAAGPYVLVVFLFNNVEVGARVSKKDKTAFTPGEMQIILNADAPTPWIPKSGAEANGPEWARADKATVTYDPAAKMLIFATRDMLNDLHGAAPGEASASGTALLAPSAPVRPPGDFAPAAPTPWNIAPLSTNAAPATP